MLGDDGKVGVNVLVVRLDSREGLFRGEMSETGHGGHVHGVTTYQIPAALALLIQAILASNGKRSRPKAAPEPRSFALYANAVPDEGDRCADGEQCRVECDEVDRRGCPDVDNGSKEEVVEEEEGVLPGDLIGGDLGLAEQALPQNLLGRRTHK